MGAAGGLPATPIESAAADSPTTRSQTGGLGGRIERVHFAGRNLRLARLHAPGEPKTFEQSADSSGLLFDRSEPRLNLVDSSAEPKHESRERDPAGEYRDEFG